MERPGSDGLDASAVLESNSLPASDGAGTPVRSGPGTPVGTPPGTPPEYPRRISFEKKMSMMTEKEVAKHGVNQATWCSSRV